MDFWLLLLFFKTAMFAVAMFWVSFGLNTCCITMYTSQGKYMIYLQLLTKCKEFIAYIAKYTFPKVLSHVLIQQ